MSILEVDHLRKEYKGFVLDDISFKLDRGYIMGFIGPNGAGKSTTIKLIMNLIRKDGGDIKVFGKDNLKFEKEIKSRIGFVYDYNHFYDELTLGQMKKVIANFYSTWDEKAFKKYMNFFNLDEHKKVKEISKGMQMKFSLALAISHQAELLIMDEPTSGLDPVFRREMLDILMEIMQDENKAIFFSTHITADLDRVSDYITFIKEGQIVFSSDKDEILEEYAIVKGNNNMITSDRKAAFIGIKKNKFGFEALTKKPGKIREWYGDDVVLERPTLDDIMLYTIRGNKHG